MPVTRTVVNKTISMEGEPWTIVGVLPKSFAPQLLPRPGELVVWTPKIVQEHEKRIRASGWWNVVARLAPGVTVEQAQSEMDTISAALARENPRTNATSSAVVVPLREHLMGGVGLPLVLMLGAVVLVLGIGCANVVEPAARSRHRAKPRVCHPVCARGRRGAPGATARHREPFAVGHRRWRRPRACALDAPRHRRDCSRGPSAAAGSGHRWSGASCLRPR